MNNALMKFVILLFHIIILVADHGVFGDGKRLMEQEIRFDQNYKVVYGGNNVVLLNQGKEVQLTMDKTSGSGFGSKMNYGSGFFHQRIKVPGRNSAGVVTAYYMSSEGSNRDELDFEFLGNKEGKPITLQTNVYANGEGGREQRLQLWFDPTKDFHNYKILRNQHQIVFYVDNIPIRVYKNKGVNYPTKPMQILSTLWDGSDWATDGGRTKVNWTYAPFKAIFQGFDITNGCQVQQGSSDIQQCGSEKYWWNAQKYWQLDPSQERVYEYIKKKYVNYDYCSDKSRYPTPPVECKE